MSSLRCLFVVIFLGKILVLNAAETNAETAKTKHFKAFEELMTGAKLVGQFTLLGQDGGERRQEEYGIESVQKMPEGDLWLFKARVKYGKVDITLPMILEVKWAGDTPVITLTESSFPGLGTFSARVVIYGGQYAGIWQHGKVGGQMFGEVKTASKQKL